MEMIITLQDNADDIFMKLIWQMVVLDELNEDRPFTYSLITLKFLQTSLTKIVMPQVTSDYHPLFYIL